MRSVQVTPGGIRVCGRAPLTAEELSAVDTLADLAAQQEQARLAALSPAERAADDARRAEGQARLRRLQRRAQEDR